MKISPITGLFRIGFVVAALTVAACDRSPDTLNDTASAEEVLRSRGKTVLSNVPSFRTRKFVCVLQPYEQEVHGVDYEQSIKERLNKSTDPALMR